MVGLLACTLAEARGAETEAAAAGAPTRQILCTFKLTNGLEETYVGEAKAVNLSAAEVTLLWRVKAPPTMPPSPGFLEQVYAADPRTPANQVPDLIGEANASVVMQTLSDKTEGSASAKKRSPADGVVVLRVELRLKSTTG